MEAAAERRRRINPGRRQGERVSPLELFFDLVFVLAITQCTQLMADNPTWEGIGQGLLVLGAAVVGVGRLLLADERRSTPTTDAVRAVIFAAMARAADRLDLHPRRLRRSRARGRDRLRLRPLRAHRPLPHRQPRRPRAAPLRSWSRRRLHHLHRADGRRDVPRARRSGRALGHSADARRPRDRLLRRRGLAGPAGPLRRALRPDRPDRARRVDRRDRGRRRGDPDDRDRRGGGRRDRADRRHVVDLLRHRLGGVGAPAGEGRGRSRAEHAGPRLLLLHALRDGRRHRAHRPGAEEDDRRRRPPAEDETAFALLGGVAIYLLGLVMFRYRHVHTINWQRLAIALALLASRARSRPRSTPSTSSARSPWCCGR